MEITSILDEPLLDKFLKAAVPDADPESLETAELAKNVYRITDSKQSWVIKRTSRLHKEKIIFELFNSYNVPQFDLQVLNDRWICMSDLDSPTIGQFLENSDPSSDKTAFFAELGRMTATAFLGGFRDRNLRNVLYNNNKQCCFHVDYASGWEERLHERIFRPHRLLAYLAGRLLIDPLVELEKQEASFPDYNFPKFQNGLLKEAERLAGQRLPAGIVSHTAEKLYMKRSHSLLTHFESLWPRALKTVRSLLHNSSIASCSW